MTHPHTYIHTHTPALIPCPTHIHIFGRQLLQQLLRQRDELRVVRAPRSQRLRQQRSTRSTHHRAASLQHFMVHPVHGIFTIHGSVLVGGAGLLLLLLLLLLLEGAPCSLGVWQESSRDRLLGYVIE